MNSLFRIFKRPSCVCGVLLASFSLVTGCNRDDVQVYRVAKSQSLAAADSGNLPPGHPASGASTAPPELKWTLPPGWQEVSPGEMRVASFKVQDGNKQAELGVVPLPGLMGRDLESVNRWRTSVGMPAVTEEELPKLAQKIEVAGQQADLYEQAGENPGSGDKTRILAAIMRRDNVAWFFKLTGDDELVTKEKPAFLSLLTSLRFEPAGNGNTISLPASHPPLTGVEPMATAGGSSGQDKPSWDVPTGWKEAPAGQFLVAKYTISGQNNAQAAVNVSMSAGAGGGVAGNVNRWRGQLGLGELSEGEIEKLLTPFEAGGSKGVLVEISGNDARSGQKARLVGAIVPKEGVTWFYKLMGNEQVVESQKTAFSNFVRTAKYNN